MERFISPDDQERLTAANSDASMEGKNALSYDMFEPSGYYTASELQDARDRGDIVVIRAFGVAIVSPRPQTAAE